MLKSIRPKIAIVDYGMSNLFSVKSACEHCNAIAMIASSAKEILDADGVILPGVGAFGNAMYALDKLGLLTILQETALSSKPFMGICLGMQLLMKRSLEFGHHEGLGLIEGSVVGFDNLLDNSGRHLKVPHIGWAKIQLSELKQQYMLEGIDDEEFMYFNHSFYVKLDNIELCSSISCYGNIEFCSSIQYKNIFACQFHPERSGEQGLKIYKNFVSLAIKRMESI